MLYKIHSVKLYDHDADNFVYNRVTAIVHFSTAYKTYRLLARFPAQMMEDKEAVKDFMEHRVHSHLIHYVWGKSISMVNRLKVAGKKQFVVYTITAMDIWEYSRILEMIKQQ